MTAKKKVLILYTSVGSGHKMAAEAVRDELLSRGVIAKTENIFDYSKINIRSISDRLYPKNKIVGLIYDYIWHQKLAIDFSKKSFSFLKDNFSSIGGLILKFKPDAIICTHSFGGMLNFSRFTKVPVFAIATDYRVSNIWINLEFDYYFVSNSVSVLDLVKRGIPEDRIFVTGIPVRKQFVNIHRTEKQKKKSILRIFTLVGGVNDVMKYYSLGSVLIDQLEHLAKNHLVTAICGSNVHFADKLTKLKNKNIVVIGKTNEVGKLISNSDVVVIKPGGLICSETTALGKPMVLIGRGYGQEKGNVDYLVNNGAAIQIDNLKSLRNTIKILESGDLLKKMSKNSLRIGKPNATQSVVDVVMNKIS